MLLDIHLIHFIRWIHLMLVCLLSPLRFPFFGVYNGYIAMSRALIVSPFLMGGTVWVLTPGTTFLNTRHRGYHLGRRKERKTT